MRHFVDNSKVCKVKQHFYFGIDTSPDALCARARVRALSGAPAQQTRSRDEVRVAAFCAVSLFPRVASGFT